MAKIIHVDMPRSSKQSELTDREAVNHYRKMQNARNDSRRKRPAVTLPAVKLLDEDKDNG